jgi:tetratricopeptide (TPR) repeat protein
MTQSQDTGRTWAESLESAARYFTHTEGGAFRFAVTDDELVQRRFNTELRQVLRGKGVPVQIHDWSKASPPDMYPAEQLRRLKAAHPETKGIICVGLERAMWENPEMLTMLNFAREALAEVGVPLFFWISFRTLPLMSRFAIDLYNQRIGANLYFEHDAETADTDGSAMRYIAHETVQANRDLRPLEARLKLLEKQFDELKKIESPEKLANDIVLELLKVYVQIPGMVSMVRSLLDEYGGFVDLGKPENCFDVATIYEYLGDVQQAEQHYEQALKQLRILAEENPQGWLPHVAVTLNNLANLQKVQYNYKSAEKGYRKALDIRRELAESNPQTYLPDVAQTLNNLAALQCDLHNYESAEKGYREAQGIYQKLVKSNPQKYLPHVAISIYNLAILQKKRNDFDSAEKGYRDALEIWRELLISNPQSYLQNVAQTLNNLANLQKARNDYESAEKGYRDALEIKRELAAINPKKYLPDFILTLNNLALLQRDRHDYESAEKSLREVLENRRKLAESNPQTYLTSVARTLSNMGMLYQDGLPHREKSLACVREALSILLPLKDRLPKARKDFEKSLQVIKDWGLDPDEFIANLNKPTNSAPSPES